MIDFELDLKIQEYGNRLAPVELDCNIDPTKL